MSNDYGYAGFERSNVAQPDHLPDARNMIPTLPDDLNARMVALVKAMAVTETGEPFSYCSFNGFGITPSEAYAKARAIVAEMDPVDGDEREAQKLNDDSPYDLTGLDAEHAARNVRYIGATILAAIKRGRALERGEGK